MEADPKTAAYIRKSARQTFNEAWKFLDKKKLTQSEKATLLHLVHASFYLWQQVKEHTATHTSIGWWQISRAYAHIGDGTNALLFAEQNIRLCKAEKPDGFYTAYAHESAARAHILTGSREKAAVQIRLALKAIQDTAEKETDPFFKDISELKKLL